jgi:hypothetical protein
MSICQAAPKFTGSDFDVLVSQGVSALQSIEMAAEMAGQVVTGENPWTCDFIQHRFNDFKRTRRMLADAEIERRRNMNPEGLDPVHSTARAIPQVVQRQVPRNHASVPAKPDLKPASNGASYRSMAAGFMASGLFVLGLISTS